MIKLHARHLKLFGHDGAHPKYLKLLTSGMIPKNPVADPVTIAGIIAVLSFIAVGENNQNTPTLQIKRNRMKGMILKMIDATLRIYLLSSFGPHA